MLCEQKNTLRDESGYQLQLDEIAFNQIDLKWGSYIAPHEKVLSFHPDKQSIVSHFRIFDAARDAGGPGTGGGLGTRGGRTQSIREKQFVVYRESPEPYDLYVSPTKDKTCSFFELIMSDHFFDNLFTEESEFLVRFHSYISASTPSFDFTAPMTPAMYGIIQEMQNAPYNGYLKGIYLEAKAVELFLMQVEQLDRKGPGKPSKLRPKDIESLHGIRDYIDLHYDQPCPITDLARKAGINQMKLKNGFKELFNTTVFGYLSDIRLREAKRLLLEEKMYVGEVADRIGYKHPHHFAAAFRKKFGVTPRELKK